jgi:hypothetical protein
MVYMVLDFFDFEPSGALAGIYTGQERQFGEKGQGGAQDYRHVGQVPCDAQRFQNQGNRSGEYTG